MSARRNARQLVLDDMAEDADFRPELCQLIVGHYRGAFMHPERATVRKGRTITPTNVPWPDLTLWFPEAYTFNGPPALHLVELKSHDHRGLRGGQAELFASLEAAGVSVPIWEPRDLDDKIPEQLERWSGRPRPPGLFVPRSRAWAKRLTAANPAVAS